VQCHARNIALVGPSYCVNRAAQLGANVHACCRVPCQCPIVHETLAARYIVHPSHRLTGSQQQEIILAASSSAQQPAAAAVPLPAVPAAASCAAAAGPFLAFLLLLRVRHA
jgi:hypothetical protein